jgi:hypothetical protein
MENDSLNQIVISPNIALIMQNGSYDPKNRSLLGFLASIARSRHFHFLGFSGGGDHPQYVPHFRSDSRPDCHPFFQDMTKLNTDVVLSNIR